MLKLYQKQWGKDVLDLPAISQYQQKNATVSKVEFNKKMYLKGNKSTRFF